MTRLIRAAATRVRRVANALASRWSDTLLAGRRTRWGLAGRLSVPEEAWPATPDADALASPLGCRVMPLPPARGLSRWLWGDAGNRIDGGDRSSGLLALCLSETGLTPGREAYFATADAVALVAERAAADSDRLPHTLLLVADDAAADVARSLRRAGVNRGCLVLDDPGSERRSVLLSLCAAAAVPASTDPLRSPWAREASAAGVALLFHSATSPLPRDLGHPTELRIAGRTARHALVSTDPAMLKPMTNPMPERPRHSALVVGAERRRVVVAGHDLKFARALIEHLGAEGHEVRLDEWSGHERHDPRRSAALANWADVVFCEWVLGNAAWYSRHLPDGTRLSVRLHLQETATGFPDRVRFDRVDAAVFVAEHLRRQVVRDVGWVSVRTVVIPNAVRIPNPEDIAADPNRRFRLGLVGMVPSRKGLHVALDVISRLRAHDDRYTLHVKGRLPSEYPWLTDRPRERDYFGRQLARIEQDRALGAAVTFDPFGPDMASWFGRIGVALSTSSFESFHFTLPDGAAHGALPRSLSWPGADLLYPLDWLAPDAGTLAESILTGTSEPHRWSAQAEDARRLVAHRFGQSRIIPLLADVILGRRRAHSDPILPTTEGL